MISVIGLHPDGWLEASSIFDVVNVSKVEFTVYLPPLPSGNEGKLIFIIVGAELHQAIVPRGTLSQLGPFVFGEGAGRIGLDSARAEPSDGEERRLLGVNLVRVLLDDKEADLSPSADSPKPCSWLGQWPSSTNSTSSLAAALGNA